MMLRQFFLMMVLIINGIAAENEIRYNYDAYEFYPCINTMKIIETFKNTKSLYYNLTIVTSDFKILPKKLDITVKFDKYALITINFEKLFFYDDQLSVRVIHILEEKENLTFSIKPRSGIKLPNVISVQINKKEMCPDGVYKDIWDLYIDKAYITTETPPEMLAKTITDNIVLNNFTCGRRLMQQQSFITSGVTSKPGDWPWHTAIYRVDSAEGELKYICGGSVVTSTRVITAAHCVIESGAVVLPERILTVFGKYNFYGDNVHLQDKKVFKIIVHPNFSQTSLANDIAIIKLSSEVIFNDFIQPICLWDEDNMNESNKTGLIGHVVGWGTTEKEKFSPQLIESQLPIIGELNCIKSHPFYFKKLLNVGSFCAGFGNGTNVCNGDSGGGMYLSKEIQGYDKWYLKGIVSVGIPKINQNVCDPKHYTLFTDIAYYKEFIDKYI